MGKIHNATEKATVFVLVATMLGSATAYATSAPQAIPTGMVQTNNIDSNAETYVLAFTDVDSDSFYYDDVEFVTKLGLFSGTSATTFNPDGTMTRAMFVTVLGKLFELNGYEISIYGSSSFKDVVKNSWYEKYVIWAAELEIVKGYDSKTFGPNDNVTREQAAVILYKFARFMEAELANYNFNISDSASISDWAKTEVEAIVNGGIMSTLTNSNFKPKENATRAQLAEALSGYVKKYNEEIIIAKNIDSNSMPFYKNAEERAALQPWIDDVMNLKVASLIEAQREDFIGYWVGYFSKSDYPINS